MAEVTKGGAVARLRPAVVSLLLVAGLTLGSPMTALGGTDGGAGQQPTGEPTTPPDSGPPVDPTDQVAVTPSTPPPPAAYSPPIMKTPAQASVRGNGPAQVRPSPSPAHPVRTSQPVSVSTTIPPTSVAVALERAAGDTGPGVGPLIVGALLAIVLIGGAMAWRRGRTRPISTRDP